MFSVAFIEDNVGERLVNVTRRANGEEIEQENTNEGLFVQQEYEGP